jgi:hypothetical protein
VLADGLFSNQTPSFWSILKCRILMSFMTIRYCDI